MSYSLRSREGGVDVSEIAKQFGGGGHKHAAGFRLPEFRAVIAPRPYDVGRAGNIEEMRPSDS